MSISVDVARLRAESRAGGRMSPGWMLLGDCSQFDGDIWFPPVGQSVKPAQMVCAGCPVRSECLEWALGQENLDGVWGGASVRERVKIRQARKRSAVRAAKAAA